MRIILWGLVSNFRSNLNFENRTIIKGATDNIVQQRGKDLDASGLLLFKLLVEKLVGTQAVQNSGLPSDAFKLWFPGLLGY